ncbi:unnamed protein product [Dovyalis caffra]|uniref:ABC transmembrane type-1 domain-containing protein n=1 Tax=Dovyalis caffra TaxID=77055 RepID=A0AAV1R4V3_9ROSI|nr:unnamed protein product [Dovyalis caffra]
MEVQVGCWMYASERQLARLRLAFLKTVLSQDIGVFKMNLTGEKVISGVTNHMSIIQEAIGEKGVSYIFEFETYDDLQVCKECSRSDLIIYALFDDDDPVDPQTADPSEQRPPFAQGKSCD